MKDLYEKMSECGIIVFQNQQGKYCFQKFPTLSDSREKVVNNGLEISSCQFETLNETDIFVRKVLGIPEKKLYFSVQVRFDRGLGWECHNITGVCASKVAEAKNLARKEAIKYFNQTEDFGTVLKWEIRIRPGKTME